MHDPRAGPGLKKIVAKTELTISESEIWIIN